MRIKNTPKVDSTQIKDFADSFFKNATMKRYRNTQSKTIDKLFKKLSQRKSQNLKELYQQLLEKS